MAILVKRVTILAAALTCAAGISYWGLIRHPEHSLSASELSRGRRLRAPVRPMSTRLSCRATEPLPDRQPRLIAGSDVSAPTMTVCYPLGDLTFSIQASPREFLACKSAPIAASKITAGGQVRDVRILQSSGSKDLDAKISNLIASRTFAPNKCECRAQTTVGVEF